MTERRQIAIRFDAASFQRIEELADACGTSIAATVRQLTAHALDYDPEQIAKDAEAVAAKYERKVADIKQVRIVDEPQLSMLKAHHWRILAGWLRKHAANGEQGRGVKLDTQEG